MENKKPPDPIKKSSLPDIERYRMQEKMRNKANVDLARHALVEWTLVRSLAWSERIIVGVASLLFLLDKERTVVSLSGLGFVIVSLLILGPVYGIMMFTNLLGIYGILKKMGNLPKNVAGFKKIIYPTYAAWIPFIYFLSYYAMNLYYDLLKSIPVWDKVKQMWWPD